MGTFMIWYLAVAMVLAVPCGVFVALYQVVSRDDLGTRLLTALMGLGMAWSAGWIIQVFGPAFVEVMI